MARISSRAFKLSIPEDSIQRVIVEYLQILGYEVLITSRRRKRCRVCGKYSSGGDGASRGLPDLFISHQRWPLFSWVGIEVKGAKTPLSPEQKRLEGMGRIYIVRSIEDVEVLLRSLWEIGE